MKRLIKWQKDWADEFDMTGFVIMEEDGFASLINRINTAAYPYDAPFGSNESYEFESPQDVMAGMKIKTITDEDAEDLERIFGAKSFGWTPYDAF